MMVNFFRINRSKITEKDAQELIAQAIGKLKTCNPLQEREEVIRQLNEKQGLIQQQIAQTAHRKTKEKFIRSYFLFAQTLTTYIDDPVTHEYTLSNYFHSTDYYHIGGKDGKYSYTPIDNVMNRLGQASIIILIGSVITLPYHLSIGLFMLGIAISILGPTLFYAIMETLSNKIAVQQEEKDFFTTVNTLVSDASANEQ